MMLQVSRLIIYEVDSGRDDDLHCHFWNSAIVYGTEKVRNYDHWNEKLHPRRCENNLVRIFQL